MAMIRRQTVMSLGYSGLGDLHPLAAPADVVFTEPVFPNGRNFLWPDVGEPGRVLSSTFDLRDKVLLKAVRVNCPFARGMVVLQPEMIVHMYGTFGFHGAVPLGENWPNTRLDLSAPWGEWNEVNQFVEFFNPAPGDVHTVKTVFGVMEDLTVKTLALDPIWNGNDWKLELDFLFVHCYPQGEPIDYSFPPQVQNLVAAPFFESIGLTWTTDPISQSYDIYMQTLALPEVLLASKVNVGPGTYGAEGLVTGQSYTFRVVPHSYRGYGPSSLPATSLAG